MGEIQRGFAAPDGQAFTTGLLPINTHWNECDFCAQDSWKLRRNLTIDLGLRWETKMAPGSPNPTMSHPDQPLVFGAPATSTASWVSGSLFRNNFGNLGPSLGVAWDPSGNGKTSVRANYRIAYDRVNTFLFSSQVFSTICSFDDISIGQKDTRLSTIGPAQSPAGVSPASFKQPAPFSSSSIAVVDPNLKFPTTHQRALSLQHEVWRGGVVGERITSAARIPPARRIRRQPAEPVRSRDDSGVRHG